MTLIWRRRKSKTLIWLNSLDPYLVKTLPLLSLRTYYVNSYFHCLSFSLLCTHWQENIVRWESSVYHKLHALVWLCGMTKYYHVLYDENKEPFVICQKWQGKRDFWQFSSLIRNLSCWREFILKGCGVSNFDYYWLHDAT